MCRTLTARGAGEWHSGMILYSEQLEETTNLEKRDFVVADFRYDEGIRPRKDGNCPCLTTKNGGAQE